jgi:hypothetical protein
LKGVGCRRIRVYSKIVKATVTESRRRQKYKRLKQVIQGEMNNLVDELFALKVERALGKITEEGKLRIMILEFRTESLKKELRAIERKLD